MGKITPAAIRWLRNLADGRQISSHSSQRDALLHHGYVTYSNGRYSITEAGREFLRVKNPQGNPMTKRKAKRSRGSNTRAKAAARKITAQIKKLKTKRRQLYR